MARYTNFPNGVAVGTFALDPNAGLVLGANGTGIAGMIISQATLSPTVVAANTTAEQTFAVANVGSADVVLAVNKPSAQAGLGIVGQRVAAAGTIGITFINATGATIVPTASEVYDIVTATPG